MSKYEVYDTNIDKLKIIKPFKVEDERGNFIKFYEKDFYNESGISFTPYEAFESTSKKGVLRGMHFQIDKPQAKIIRVSYGKIYDVVIDLRSDSKTFGKWYGIEMSKENQKVLYIPRGFAHGFLTLSDIAVVSYMCDGKYSKETDSGIIWNDEDINIEWPIRKNEDIIVSQRDKTLQTYREFLINK